MPSTSGDGEQPQDPYQPQPPTQPYGQSQDPYQPQPPTQPYGQSQYGQPAYGQAPYGQQPPYAQPPDHPKTTTVLVLGILGLVLCQLLAPFAWVMGKRTVREIDASGGRLGGRGAAQAGYICGIIGTVLLGLALLLLALVVVVAVLGVSASTSP